MYRHLEVNTFRLTFNKLEWETITEYYVNACIWVSVEHAI